MKNVSIPVKNKDEAKAIEAAMTRPDVRAFVVVVGTLMPFDKAEQRRIMNYLWDRFVENPGGNPHA